MSVAAYTTTGTRVIDAVLAMLAAAGISATRDAGAFYPHPVGVLVGLPALTARGIASMTYTVPVSVVSGDPLSTVEAVDRVYALADDCALALSVNEYAVASYQTSANSEPLPAVELTAVCTVELT